MRPGGKTALAAGAAALALAGIAVVISTGAFTSPSPGQQAEGTVERDRTTARAPRVSAAVAYPLDSHRDTIAFLEGRLLRRCISSDRPLTLLDLTEETLLYSDGGRLFAIGTDCGSPTLLLDPRPASKTPNRQVDCAMIGPAGMEVVASTRGGGVWLVDLVGASSERIADGRACSWIDDDHVLHEAYLQVEPAALTLTGDLIPLAEPDVWRGDISPVSMAAVFETYDPDDQRWIHHVRAPNGARITVPAAHSWCHETGSWDPTGRWLLRVEEDRFTVLDETGALHFAARPEVGCEAVALLDARHALIGGTIFTDKIASRAWILDVATGELQSVGLPGHVPAKGYGIHVRAIRSPIHRSNARSFLDPPRMEHTDQRRQLRFALSQGWSVDGWCSSSRDPTAAAGEMSTICARWRPPAGHSPDWILAYGVTDLDPDRVMEQYRARAPQQPCDGVSGPPCGRVLREGSIRIGDDRFRILDMGFWEGRGVYLARRIGGRTLVIELGTGFHESDPLVRAVISSFEPT